MTIPIALAIIVSLLLSCAPQPALKSPLPPEKIEVEIPPAPSELVATSGDESAVLRWRTNLSANSIIGGYNVYLAAENAAFRKVNSEPYPGDTKSDSAFESITITELENGVVYRACVVTLATNGVGSASLDTTDLLPRPQGKFVLRQSYSGAQAGYCFAAGKHVASDDLENDLYLTVIKGGLNLASPHRLDAVLRQTIFYRTDTYGDLAQPRSWVQPADGRDKIEFEVGGLTLLQTQDDRYALLRCESFDAEAVTAEFSYVFQTRPKTLRFH